MNDFAVEFEQAKAEFARQVEVLASSPALTLASSLPLYDLLIATRKYGYNTTSQADAPILWWKLSGRSKETPPVECRLTDPAIQKRLENYELMDTEVHAGQVIRKYRKLCTFNVAPGDGGISDQDLNDPLPAETRRMIRQALERNSE